MAVAVLLGVVLGAVATLSTQSDGVVRSTSGSTPVVLPPPSAKQVDPSRFIESTYLAWIPGGLPEGFGQAIGRARGVRRAIVVAGDNVWMTGSRTGGGESADDPARPYAIPLDAAAVAPRAFGAFLPRAERSVAASLARGEGVLGESSARLRGLGPGAELTVDGRTIRVAAVLPDELVGASELLVARRTGRAIGVTHDRYALLRLRGRPRAARVVRTLAPAAAGAPLQVRAPGETPFLRQGDSVLPPVKAKEIFGEFSARPDPDAQGFLEIDPSWVREHIATRHVPLLGDITCNTALFPQLFGAMRELHRRGLDELVRTQHGCYVPKFILNSPTAAISHHAWGMGFDINLAGNAYGQPPHQPKRLVRVLERWGFIWGGRFVAPDGSHFEYRRPAAAQLSPEGS